MKLGILMNTDRHLAHLLGLVTAARAKGHEVTVFAMDGATLLLHDRALVELARRDGVSVTVCDHSAKERGVRTEDVAKEITVAGQYSNALMAHEVDRMIVL